ncbi:MAG: hypothetical protein QOI53_2666 [Verrucomicrobiota bacterium]|nr:hypothetical protein [Verrucomicrobiota bacterium]
MFRGAVKTWQDILRWVAKENAGWLRSEEVKQDALRTRLGARRTLNAERQTLNVLPSAGFGGAKKGGQDLDVVDRFFQRERLFGSFADAPGE